MLAYNIPSNHPQVLKFFHAIEWILSNERIFIVLLYSKMVIAQYSKSKRDIAQEK
jgi:hypothetical protein